MHTHTNEFGAINKFIADTAEQAEAPDTFDYPSRLRRGTIVTTVIGCVSVLAVTGVLGAGLAVLGVFGLLAIPAALHGAWKDWRTPDCRQRNTPESAVKCYYGAIRQRRHDIAFTTLSDAALGSEVVPPPIPQLRSQAIMVPLNDERFLYTYWHTLVHDSRWFGMRRRLKKVRTRVCAGEGNLRGVETELTIAHSPGWLRIVAVLVSIAVTPMLTLMLGIAIESPILVLLAFFAPALFVTVVAYVLWLAMYLVTRGAYKTTFITAVHRHRSQWTMLTGEMDSAFDAQLIGDSKLNAEQAAAA